MYHHNWLCRSGTFPFQRRKSDLNQLVTYFRIAHSCLDPCSCSFRIRLKHRRRNSRIRADTAQEEEVVALPG